MINLKSKEMEILVKHNFQLEGRQAFKKYYIIDGNFYMFTKKFLLKTNSYLKKMKLLLKLINKKQY